MWCFQDWIDKGTVNGRSGNKYKGSSVDRLDNQYMCCRCSELCLIQVTTSLLSYNTFFNPNALQKEGCFQCTGSRSYWAVPVGFDTAGLKKITYRTPTNETSTRRKLSHCKLFSKKISSDCRIVNYSWKKFLFQAINRYIGIHRGAQNLVSFVGTGAGIRSGSLTGSISARRTGFPQNEPRVISRTYQIGNYAWFASFVGGEQLFFIVVTWSAACAAHKEWKKISMQDAPCAGKASAAQCEYTMLESLAAPPFFSDVFLQANLLGYGWWFISLWFIWEHEYAATVAFDADVNSVRLHW
jgi:hypothetical protein